MAAKRWAVVVTPSWLKNIMLLKNIKFPPSPKTKKPINEWFDHGMN